MPGTILHATDIAINKTDQSLSLRNLHTSEETMNKQIIISCVLWNTYCGK